MLQGIKCDRVIELLFSAGYISIVDLCLAQELLKEKYNRRHDLVALICYLSLTARCGHLCIKIDGEKISPDPHSTLRENRNTTNQDFSDEYESLHEFLINIFAELICRVAQYGGIEEKRDLLVSCEAASDALCSLVVAKATTSSQITPSAASQLTKRFLFSSMPPFS